MFNLHEGHDNQAIKISKTKSVRYSSNIALVPLH